MVIHVKRAGCLPPQGWQLCRVMGGSFRVKWVAALPCNRWQLCREIRKVLAERTQAIENCLYYPFIILLGFLAAHSTLFDNWHFFPSIIVIMAVSVSSIVAFTILLHRSVKVVRETSIETMQNSKSQCFRFTNNNVELEQLQLLIDEVKNERRGAFSSFVSNPLLKALLMPSGGVGGLYLLEYLGRVG